MKNFSFNDVREALMLILGQWLPIGQTVFRTVVQHVPSPLELNTDRAMKLLFPLNSVLDSYPLETLKISEDFVKCSSQSDNIVLYISKMIPITMKQLPEYNAQCRAANTSCNLPDKFNRTLTLGKEPLKSVQHEQESQCINKDKFVAFARIYSGTLTKGKTLYIITPKHDPRNE